MRCVVALLLALTVFLPRGFSETLDLMTQHRVPREDGSGGFDVVQEMVRWAPEETAIVICDMWDRHWCEGATERVADMAPRMDRTIRKAREMGVLIIHAPSSVTKFYTDTPQRKRAKDAPFSKMPTPDGWRYPDAAKEPPLPIDDSDGGCDCGDEPCDNVNQSVWTRQNALLSIGPNDVITDDGQEMYNVLEAHGRDNVIVMGVHTNMCVLGRPFSIRANVNNGKNVLLMRDLTDSMYNAKMRPYVDHHRGTELVVEHIEKYWCPTTTSSFITAEVPHRFAQDERMHAVFLLHEKEYDTATTVSRFAEEELAGAYGWKCTYLFGDELHFIHGLEALEDADLLFVSVRRQILPVEDIARVEAFCKTGKPVVGIRTASHAFALRGDKQAADGHAMWAEFDAEVLGGNYTGHTNNKSPEDPRTYVWVDDSAKGHPVLQGVRPDPFVTTSWLYENTPLSDSATPLMMGQVKGESGVHPVAWTNISKDGSRVFYTSLGHQDDFEDKNFRRLLLNGINWTLAGK